MPAKEEHDVVLVQKVLTNTSHVTSCIVMLKDVIKVSLLQKLSAFVLSILVYI
jgi:hypothetical protein